MVRKGTSQFALLWVGVIVACRFQEQGRQGCEVPCGHILGKAGQKSVWLLVWFARINAPLVDQSSRDTSAPFERGSGSYLFAGVFPLQDLRVQVAIWGQHLSQSLLGVSTAWSS